MRVRIIANPVSGMGRAARLLPQLVEALRAGGAETSVDVTARAGDAREAAKGAGAADAVVAVGGDGTVNEVLNGLPLEAGARAPALGVLPTGTANVLAKELRLTRRPEEVARAVLAGRTLPWDVGVREETGQRFLLMAGAGFDAAVVHDFHANRRGTIHMAQYLAWGLRFVAVYRPPRLRVEIDGAPVEGPVGFVLVFNGAEYGGPLRFSAGARPDDGLFQVLLFRRAQPRDTVRLFAHGFLAAVLDRSLSLPGAEFRPARRVRISADEPVPLQLDGDPAGFLPATFSIRPAAVRLIAPLGI